MNEYRQFTFGWLIFAVVVPMHLFMTYLYMNNMGDRPMTTSGYIVLTIVLALVCLLFYGLTTRVTSDAIVVSFGIGLIRKRIPLSRVVSVTTVKSPWYYGWGLRIIPNGTLYNISGTAGIELKFNDTRRVVRIGSQDPTSLKSEIESRLISTVDYDF